MIAMPEKYRAWSPKVERARAHLKAKGWSYRSAARETGVCYQHLSEVLNGHRDSRRLLADLLALPKRKGGAK